MTVLERRPLTGAPRGSIERATRPTRQTAELRCVVCGLPIDFARGQVATVLKHIAYGYDFAHQGQCAERARGWIFVDPQYDRPAFGGDGQRERVLNVYDAESWAAVLPNAPELVEAGDPVTCEPLRLWAVVEYRDGRRRLEGVIRSDEWLTEPGGAEFPEARTGHRASRGYVLSSSSVAAERLAWPEIRVSGERPC